MPMPNGNAGWSLDNEDVAEVLSKIDESEADDETLFKANTAITDLGYTDAEAANLLYALQQAGIIFKEMK